MTSRPLALAMAVVGIGAGPTTATAQQTIDPALVIERVEIEQHPPFRSSGIAARAITIRFLVGAEPSCVKERPQPAYTLLTDAFPWRTAHVSVPAFPELRFQSAIAIRCDANGRLAANVAGSVVVEPVAQPVNGAAVTLRTTLDQLPAVEFRWIAVASNGTEYTRAPAAGKYARWALHERTLR